MKKDIFEELFNSIPDQEPSANFTESLMKRIHLEAAKAEKKEHRWSIVALVAASVVMVGAGVYYIATTMTEYPTLPSFQIDLGIDWRMDWGIDWGIYQMPIVIGVMIMLLLVGDYWLRRRFINKKCE